VALEVLHLALVLLGLRAGGEGAEVAAQPCLDHERRRHLGEECAARRHYKQDWCRLMVRNGARGQSFAQCLADPEASGAIVKGGGLE
jgi:hypothetical protein